MRLSRLTLRVRSVHSQRVTAEEERSEATGRGAEGETSGLNPVDLVLALVALSFSATLVLLDRFAVDAFAAMFAEFGSESVLPFLTRMVISHVAPLGAAGLTLALALSGLVARKFSSGAVARGLLALGIALGISAIVLCFYGLYAPIFRLADSVKP